MIEITVRVSSEDMKYSKDFLCYEEPTLSRADPILERYVIETLEDLKITPDLTDAYDIQIRIKMVW